MQEKNILNNKTKAEKETRGIYSKRTFIENNNYISCSWNAIDIQWYWGCLIDSFLMGGSDGCCMNRVAIGQVSKQQQTTAAEQKSTNK